MSSPLVNCGGSRFHSLDVERQPRIVPAGPQVAFELEGLGDRVDRPHAVHKDPDLELLRGGGPALGCERRAEQPVVASGAQVLKEVVAAAPNG